MDNLVSGFIALVLHTPALLLSGFAAIAFAVVGVRWLDAGVLKPMPEYLAVATILLYILLILLVMLYLVANHIHQELVG